MHGFLLRDDSTLSFNDHLVVLRLAVHCEVEDRVLVGIAQIEVATCENELVIGGDAAGYDLARRGDDGAAADEVVAFLLASLGDANDVPF